MSEKVSRKEYQQRLDEMVNTLRGRMVTGEYGPGTLLPSEHELGKQFRLGNSSVRKGLDRLVEEGRIEKIPRVGSRVRSPGPEQDVVLKLGYHAALDRDVQMERLLAEFQRRHPHIQVQTMVFPSRDMMSFVTEYIRAGLLDVVSINNNQFEDLAVDGNLTLLEPLEPNGELYPFVEDAFANDGRIWARPLVFSPVVLCYNRTHFQEKNVPRPEADWTWNDLLRNARQLAIPNERFGFYFHLLSQHRWPIFMLQSGMAFSPNAEGQYELCGTKLMESLSLCQELITMPDVFPGVVSESDADAEELFREGKVSIIMTTYSGMNSLGNANLSFDVAPLPRYVDNSTMMVAIGLIVSRQSRVKHAAQLLVDFLASHESQKFIRQHTLSIPVERRAAEWQGAEAIYRPPHFSMYRELVPTFRLLKDLRLDSRSLTVLQKEARLFWFGLQDQNTFCKRVEDKWNTEGVDSALAKPQPPHP